MAIIFKKEPSEILVKELKKSGFTIIRLPDNPYI